MSFDCSQITTTAENKMQVFNNPEFGEVRTVEENGAVLFCASDVAKALGYTNPSKAINDHCRGVTKRYMGVQTGVKADGTPATQQVEMLFITEGDIYRLAARSKLPGAEKFESWIFDEVLPSIRKTGGYMIPQDYPAALRALADAEEAKLKLLSDNRVMQPKAQYFDALVERNTLTNFRETAKELGASPKKFVAFLLAQKYLYRDQRGKLLPYEAKNDGLFTVKECKSEKTPWSGTQTLVTPKGRETFRLLMACR